MYTQVKKKKSDTGKKHLLYHFHELNLSCEKLHTKCVH